jgi:hypothetical protein
MACERPSHELRLGAEYRVVSAAAGCRNAGTTWPLRTSQMLVALAALAAHCGAPG